MTSPNTLERMARAIYAGKFHQPADEMIEAPDFIQAGCFDTVRAVLEALKTVDDSTVEAMREALLAVHLGHARHALTDDVLRAAVVAVASEILNQGAEG